ncbi:MAG TPA: long-chain-fatty-acid--CoA ligase [Planctomycetota bacterium]
MSASAGLWTILARAAEHHGARPAVVEGGRTRSYAELAARVSARAAHWRAQGLAPGERVAILDWNTGTFLESYFAAAHAGAILCPLNHRLAVPELLEILRDAEVRLLVAARDFEGAAAELRRGEAGLRQVLWSEDEPAPGSAPPAPVAPDDVAQLYYTSGTTGRSKGVVLTHRNVSTHAEWAVRELSLGAADRWGHFAPMFHLADAWATFALTLVGGLHVMLPRFEADGAIEAIESQRITLTNLVPTMLKRVVESPRARRERFASLRLVLSGGAPIAPALVRQVLATFGCEYAQTYGMTETSPYLTVGLLPEALRRLPPDEVLRLRARTGRPFGGIELEVVDEHDRRVPADDRSVGEIRVRGATVTPGYWNRPEETARALRGGWLYTGDLAVVDVHGFVNIVDRKKDMILTGGENVYSTEVEHALHEHPDVLEAAVFALPDEAYGESVNAAVVLREGSAASAAELIAFCRERIAGYKVPRTLEFLPELPKTGSGKISKHLLRSARMRS